MRLADVTGLRIPLIGLFWSKNDSLTYFIKRFDRKGRNDKVPVEDFACIIIKFISVKILHDNNF
jgi:serine/threonine-protein kinase HipA